MDGSQTCLLCLHCLCLYYLYLLYHRFVCPLCFQCLCFFFLLLLLPFYLPMCNSLAAGECTQPMQLATCAHPGCGLKIGGQNHQQAEGTIKLGIGPEGASAVRQGPKAQPGDQYTGYLSFWTASVTGCCFICPANVHCSQSTVLNDALRIHTTVIGSMALC